MMNRISIYRMYSSTILLSPAYSLGFCASLFIMIQIITGYILGSNYIAKTEESFSVVNSIIMRELDTGWLIRFNHMNGCALLFICVYLHMYRSLYIHSISKTSVWIVGVLIYILLCGISLTGYSLVYGQMSLWAIVVISSMVTGIPFIGNDLLVLIWGGNIVSSVTLQRIFCVHYLLPLFLLLFILVHLYNLHNLNSTGDLYYISNRYDRVNFYGFLLFRDVFIGSLYLILYNIFVYYYSDIFGDSDNYVHANALVTPSEIMPEFYLLPFYALIRAIPDKMLGIICMFLLLLSLTNVYPMNMCISRYCMSVLSGTLLLLLLLDIYIASSMCMFINHYSSFYVLLILCSISLYGNIIYINIMSNCVLSIYGSYDNNILCLSHYRDIAYVGMYVMSLSNVIYSMELGKGLSKNYLSVIGNQWYWIYNYNESRISSLGRIILVDQPLFINSGIHTMLLISSSDLIHSFSLPSLGVKVDGIPGRVNSVDLCGLISGMYIGYCSELCGSGHGLMPINLVFL